VEFKRSQKRTLFCCRIQWAIQAIGLLVICSSAFCLAGNELYPKPGTPNSSGVKKLIKNSIGMKLVKIPAGEFLMGSPQTENHLNNRRSFI